MMRLDTILERRRQLEQRGKRKQWGAEGAISNKEAVKSERE
jgi:hypothetical protein